LLRSLASLTALVTLGVVLAAQPAPTARDVRERAWAANNLGVAYLEQFNHAKAATQFEAALALDGSFTPARVNLAIARLYEPDLAAALKAATAASANPGAPPHADFVLGLIARSENREDDAIAAFRRVLEVDPDDVASLVNLGQLQLQRREYADAVPVFARAVELEPYNVSALYNLAVAQTRAGQREQGAATTAKFQALRETGYGTTYSNAYMEQGRYAEAILSTGAEPDVVPTEAPALTLVPRALDLARGAGVRAIGAGDLNRDGHSEILVVGDAGLDIYATTPGAPPVRMRSASWPVPSTLDVRGIVVADQDNDGKADLLLHGRGGVAVWRQKPGSAATALDFEDVTTGTGITTALDVRTAALVDLDHDGDADVVIGGATRDGGTAAPLATWRNNGDGTFADITTSALPAQSPLVATAIVATDVDQRRDIDLLVLGADGRLRLWRNMRDASFREVGETFGLTSLPAARAMAVGDFNKDGFPDLALSVRDGDGVIAAGSARNRFTARTVSAMPRDAVTAQAADIDTDGLLDVVALTADGVRLARQSAGGAFEDASERAGAGVGAGLVPREAAPDVGAGRVRRSGDDDGRTSPAATHVAVVLLDADRSGSLDILALRGGAVALHAAGGVSPGFRVSLTAQVSNRSGIGSKVEMRAGSLWQKVETSASSPAAAPADLLFGIGTRTSIDVVRVLWPAGIVQAEPIGADTMKARAIEVVELDRKPSSCPYIYTWNGDRFEFVTDFLGGGEMGYQVTPGVYSTPDPEEFVRIRGDQLRERDGRFELRVTNELEETLFLDHLSLVAIDHPAGTDVFPREGLVSSPVPGLRIETLRDRRAPARVMDASGQDASRAAGRVDRAYVDGLPLLPVRGYARPHAMTVDLGPSTPAQGAVLLLTGWTDYAFSSDNIAASHAGYALHPPSLQVRDARGEWQTVIEEIGVPVGRPQTVVVDLTDRFLSASRDVRIATSMRVYWDQVEVATRVGRAGSDGTMHEKGRPGRPALPAPRVAAAMAGRAGSNSIVVTRLAAATADLRWRGFSEATSPQQPLTFDYTKVTPDSPWKQMPGRYTREGDVRELLAKVDDRFVVSRPGDEVALAFDATVLPPLRAGWTRTFLLHGDGFSKEMDINSASPDQAWPLPSHSSAVQTSTASPLDEPSWVTRFNTRVVGRQVPRLAGVAR
jgi:tetratricopeptide (TPR) repeat protein